jgi:hypothetical protein
MPRTHSQIPKEELLRVGALVRDWICDNYPKSERHNVEHWPPEAWNKFISLLKPEFVPLFDREVTTLYITSLRKGSHTHLNMGHGHGAPVGSRNRGGRVCCPSCGHRFHLGTGEAAS